MEVFVPCSTSHCPDVSSSGESSTSDPHNLIKNQSKDLSMNDLKTCLTELVNIEETGISTSGFNLSPEKNDIGNVVKGSECKDLDKSTSGTVPEKCFSKCATFPPLRGPKSSGDVFTGEKGKRKEEITAEVSDGNGSAKPSNQCYSRSTSLPVPLKLVSAMKGSREKQQQGTSAKKLSVTWAPGVYVPIPTSVSHVPSDKNQRYRNSGKKSGKYKQKSGSKSSRGSSKSEGKKQGRKSSGGSNNKLKKPFHIDSGVVLVEPQVGILEYNVGSPDPFCGSSFLKESITKLHFPVAEAT